MSKVDLERYVFDYDLTFAVLLMSADGTIYHRFGGRDHRSATAWLSMKVLIETMRETLVEHAAREPRSSPPASTSRTILDIPPFARGTKDKKLDCVHCHSVLPALREEAQEQGSWRPENIWVWPAPEQIGIRLDGDDQARVLEVAPGSAADRAGLHAGDRLLRSGAQRLLTIADLQGVLHFAAAAATSIPLAIARAGEVDPKSLTIELAAGWKVGTPLTFSWRPSKWELPPTPGFGGELLEAAARRDLGLADTNFALRIDYLVTWGPRTHVGKSAAKAGLRKGDIVLAVAGKSDFQSHDHFHAWYRLTRERGEKVEIELLRDGARMRITLPVVE